MTIYGKILALPLVSSTILCDPVKIITNLPLSEMCIKQIAYGFAHRNFIANINKCYFKAAWNKVREQIAILLVQKKTKKQCSQEKERYSLKFPREEFEKIKNSGMIPSNTG